MQAVNHGTSGIARDILPWTERAFQLSKHLALAGFSRNTQAQDVNPASQSLIVDPATAIIGHNMIEYFLTFV